MQFDAWKYKTSYEISRYQDSIYIYEVKVGTEPYALCQLKNVTHFHHTYIYIYMFKSRNASCAVANKSCNKIVCNQNMSLLTEIVYKYTKDLLQFLCANHIRNLTRSFKLKGEVYHAIINESLDVSSLFNIIIRS